MGTVIKLSSHSGEGDGYRRKLALEREKESSILVDAATLGPCHPMFIVRLRLFVDWHIAAGHDVSILPPDNPDVSQQLADIGFANELPAGILARSLPTPLSGGGTVLPVRRLGGYHDVEDAAQQATEVLERQARELATWGDAMHMAISELCDNAIEHGRNDLGAYVSADRVEHPQRQFRLAIADLGIGIPEHIRARHPEWQDDTAAIARALERGVSGTGDPHRGNGYAEIFAEALETKLIRAGSAATLDIRSAKGRVSVELVGGQRNVKSPPSDAPRRGTWISYTVTSA